MSVVRRFRMVAVAMVLAVTGVLAASPVSATSASADLAVSVQPQNQVITIYQLQIWRFLFTATAVNHGPNQANNVVLSEHIGGLIQQSTVKVSAPIPCTVSGLSPSGFTVTCTESSLAPAATDNVVITYSGFAMHNTTDALSATVSSATPDPNAANNTARGTVFFICNAPLCWPR